jgi:CsoR family transcriptional regulator, copper-sensing transcriptional repressor
MPLLKNCFVSLKLNRPRSVPNARVTTPTNRSQPLPAAPPALVAAPAQAVPPSPELAVNTGCGAAHLEKTMKIEDSPTRQDLLKRLRRVEGQVRGVQTMISDERNCHEILQQLTAIQSAMRSVSLQLVESSAATCFQEMSSTEDANQRDLILQDLLSLVKKAS